MPQVLKGTLIEDRLADDTLVFRAKFRTLTRTLGSPPDWDRTRAEKFIANTLRPSAQLGQPWWELIPRGEPEPHEDGPVTFHEAASDKVDQVLGLRENLNTQKAFASPVRKHLLPYFAYERDKQTDRVLRDSHGAPRLRAMSDVDDASVTAFIVAKRNEREVLSEVSDILDDLDSTTRSDLALLRESFRADEWELLLRYGQRGGRWALSDPEARGRVSLSSPGLNNGQINLCLSRLRAIVRFANRRFKLTLEDPTVDQRLEPDEPDHDWVQPRQLQAMFDAAAELDAGVDVLIAPRVDARHGKSVPIQGYVQPARAASTEQGRTEALKLLGLCGLRVSEFADAVDRDVRREGLRIPKSKTKAGVRVVTLPDVVREALNARRGRRYIFETAAGTRRDRNNVRNRLLAPVVERASELLSERGHDPLPDRVTPHTMRRTAITYWAWAGRQQRWAMQQAGHKSGRVTTDCYQQAFPDDPEALAMVLNWHRGLPALPWRVGEQGAPG